MGHSRCGGSAKPLIAAAAAPQRRIQAAAPTARATTRAACVLTLAGACDMGIAAEVWDTLSLPDSRAGSICRTGGGGLEERLTGAMAALALITETAQALPPAGARGRLGVSIEIHE